MKPASDSVAGLALTFDDGPSAWSEAILDLLAEHDAKATFFAVGSSAEQRLDLLERMTAEGHEIGNHTWSHPSLARDCDDDQVRVELERTNDLVAGTVGVAPRLYRAPYFDLDDRVDTVARSLGLRHVPADVQPPDWHSGWSAKLTIAYVLSRVHPDAVVCLHDGVAPGDDDGGQCQATVDAVAAILPRLADRGLRCVTASTLLAEAEA